MLASRRDEQGPVEPRLAGEFAAGADPHRLAASPTTCVSADALTRHLCAMDARRRGAAGSRREGGDRRGGRERAAIGGEVGRGMEGRVAPVARTLWEMTTASKIKFGTKLCPDLSKKDLAIKINKI